MWIIELKKLDKILDVQSIMTDSLVQEVSLWNDIARVYEQFVAELKQDHVIRIEELLNNKSKIID